MIECQEATPLLTLLYWGMPVIPALLILWGKHTERKRK